MKRMVILTVVCCLYASTACAHGDISKLPDSVQIMQLKMQLYMDKNNVDTLNKLAMAYFRTGQYEDAKEQLELALDNDKNNFDALDGMGMVLYKMGDYKKAARYLKQALSVKSEDVMVHVHLAMSYEKLDMTELAKKEMDEARSLAKGGEGIQAIEKELEILKSIGK